MSPAPSPAASIWLLRTRTICAARLYLPKKSKSCASQSGATLGVGLGYAITTRFGVVALWARWVERNTRTNHAVTHQRRIDREQLASAEKRVIDHSLPICAIMTRSLHIIRREKINDYLSEFGVC